MRLEYRKTRVCENIEISNGIFKLAVEKSPVEKPVPGQFMMLRTAGYEPFLSRPISIHNADGEKLYFVFEVKGNGTRNLSRLKKDEEIEMLGPLGNGFQIENIKGRVAILSGGMGIAPMNYLAKSLMDCEIDLYAGFRNEIYGVDSIKRYVNNVNISTEDGSVGLKGYVTEMLNPLEYDVVLCCGPEIMMKKVVQSCNDKSVPVYISMEKHMACGVGACLVCTCKTKEGNKRTCKDGPVFSGRDVIFDD
jgi:dihydroorotate dehydrogenase electron transfer subunit